MGTGGVLIRWVLVGGWSVADLVGTGGDGGGTVDSMGCRGAGGNKGGGASTCTYRWWSFTTKAQRTPASTISRVSVCTQAT